MLDIIDCFHTAHSHRALTPPQPHSFYHLTEWEVFSRMVFVAIEVARASEEKFKKMKDIYTKLREEHVNLLRTVSHWSVVTGHMTSTFLTFCRGATSLVFVNDSISTVPIFYDSFIHHVTCCLATRFIEPSKMVVEYVECLYVLSNILLKLWP